MLQSEGRGALPCGMLISETGTGVRMYLSEGWRQ